MLQPVSETYLRRILDNISDEYEREKIVYRGVLRTADVYRNAKFDDYEVEGLTPYIMYNTVDEVFIVTSLERLEMRYH